MTREQVFTKGYLPFKAKDEVLWKEFQDKVEQGSQEHLGLVLASQWANKMEEEMSKGKRIFDCAQAAWNEVDPTGLMSGAGTSIIRSLLYTHWAHGGELRDWEQNRSDPRFKK